MKGQIVRALERRLSYKQSKLHKHLDAGECGQAQCVIDNMQDLIDVLTLTTENESISFWASCVQNCKMELEQASNELM